MVKNTVEKEKISIVAGLPRTGTTFLYHNLQKHPSVFVPYRKELAFFIYYYSKGIDWYLDHFSSMKPHQIGIDVSSIYLLHNFSIERIKDFNPDIKLIVGVRDPVEFALSMYAQANSYSFRLPSFEDFIINYRFSRINDKLNIQLADNFVPRTLEKIQNAFGDNLLLYNYKFLKEDPLAILKAIESFVEIPQYFNENNFDNVVINSGSRRHIKFVSSLLATRDIYPRMLRALFPESVIKAVKRRKDKAVSMEKCASMQSYPPEHIRLAEKVFAGQRNYFNNFFSKSQILLGSGTPF